MILALKRSCPVLAVVWLSWCAPAGAVPAAGAVTFSENVWPILQQRCVTCHQAGEIAPMAFTSYKEVRPWAAAIREAVSLRVMPPWDAEANPGHSFRNDRSLSISEIKIIAAWVDNGCPEGPALPPFQAKAQTHKWKLGEPDLVVTVPGFPVPDSGVLPYSFLILPLRFTEDTWVRAAEFRIDQRAVIHHINAFVRSPGSSFLSGFPEGQIFAPTLAERASRRQGEALFDRRQLLLGYEPGYEPKPWLDSGAKLIKAGSQIVLEMHYTPNGKKTVDRSELGLYFAKSSPQNRVLAIDTLRDLDLRIPPESGNYISTASMTLDKPVKLLSVQPHMHLRGKSMEVRAIYPDGRSDTLLNVPKYDFNWQTTYVFSTPLTLPAGTRIESVASFDNSKSNSHNPDPEISVHWGDQTTDEMHIAFLELVIDAKTDPETVLASPPKLLESHKQ